MTIIIKKYVEKCKTPSDINKLLPILKQYAEKCTHITEMGVRGVNSTWGLLAGGPKKMISYDIEYCANIGEVMEAALQSGIDYTFIEGDVLEIEIEETELLFIDTYHHYNQLYNELILHSNKVSKYILIHDTTAYAKKNALMSAHYTHVLSKLNKEMDKFSYCKKKGLMPAIKDYLRINNNWYLKKRYFKNNGLTILCRKNN
jgi:hypothetical protein